MPQFDASTYASQLFWLFICFGILCVGLARFILPRLAKQIEWRSQYINQHEQWLQELNEEYHDLEMKQRILQDQMQKEVLHLMQTSRKELNDLKQTERSVVNEELKKALLKAQESIDEELNRLDLEAMATALAEDVCRKIQENTKEIGT
jgi:F-type H+-transporting ATPase subunit b